MKIKIIFFVILVYNLAFSGPFIGVSMQEGVLIGNKFGNLDLFATLDWWSFAKESQLNESTHISHEFYLNYSIGSSYIFYKNEHEIYCLLTFGSDEHFWDGVPDDSYTVRISTGLGIDKYLSRHILLAGEFLIGGHIRVFEQGMLTEGSSWVTKRWYGFSQGINFKFIYVI
jgi:hypothetical protein